MRQASLESAGSDAVVRPVRSDGEAVTPQARRLDAAAGERLADRLAEQGELLVGGALVTAAGRLDATFLIHVVVQSLDEPVTQHGVQRALVNALRRARDLGLASVSFPLVGCGAGNLDAEDAADTLVGVLRDHLLDPDPPRSFEILVETEYERTLCEALVVAGSGRYARGGSSRERNGGG